MAAKFDRRPDELAAAEENGWAVTTENTSHGAVSDQFRRGNLVLTCFWSRSVRSEACNGLLEGDGNPRQVWHIAPSRADADPHTPGILEVLQSSR
jgi:hypothetical protein